MKFFWLGFVALGLAACGKKAEPTIVPTASETPTTAAPVAAQPSSAPMEAPTDLSSTLNRLTQAVRKYSAENRRVPSSLEELVAAGYLPEVPATPSGKRFVIDKELRVVLK